MKKIFSLIVILILSTTAINAAESNIAAVSQYNQGIDYYKMGRYEDSIKSFKKSIKLDPNYIDAYYNLGSVLEYLQQYEAALTIFKQVIVRKPSDYDSVYKAAWLSHKLGEDAKAKIYLKIIPQNCSRAKDAKELALQLNDAFLPNEQQMPKDKNISNNLSGMYLDIPAPTGITADNKGNIYIAEFNNNNIIKITPNNEKIIYLKDSKINGPIGLAIDKSGNMYIANYNKDNILKVSNLGEISELINNVKKPYCLYILNDLLFVSCQGSDSVLKYKLP
jgi:tetratricopeptide (TPR) repeat protein